MKIHNKCVKTGSVASSHLQLQEVQAEREKVLTSNRSLAEDSLARRPRLCSAKFQLAQKYTQLARLAAACWEKQSQLGELMG